jgi:hypothetical protein
VHKAACYTSCPWCASCCHPCNFIQPCLENKSLGRKQTLTYLKGYPNQDPDVSGLMSYDGSARPAQSPKIAALSISGSLKGAAAGDAASPESPQACGSPLPKWVEQDRQVCRHAKGWVHCSLHPAGAMTGQHNPSTEGSLMLHCFLHRF